MNFRERRQLVNDKEQQLEVQLAGCLTAADGWINPPAKQGDYGWSVAYEQTLQLRLKYDRLRKAVRGALNELGVARPGYPEPVANAVDMLNGALAGLKLKKSSAKTFVGPAASPAAIRRAKRQR